jgi:hypothetical protein
MDKNEFTKLYWGFLFIMIGFRIQGFDILPDIVGYLLFASAFNNLASRSAYFETAAKFNIFMIIFSIFSIYQFPAPDQGQGINLGPLGIFSIPLAIASVLLNLLVVYNLFRGIKDISEKCGEFDLAGESDDRWREYKILQTAVLFSFILIFIPPIAVVFFIVLFIMSIIIAISIMRFIKKCGERLAN